MRPKNILCDAVAFGYGPVAKLLTILGRLPSDHRVTVLAENSSLALATASFGGNIVHCDTDDVRSLERVSSHFDEADLFINVMNPTSAELARRKGVPTVVIDSLFWMWDSLPASLSDANLYVIQNFLGVAEQLGRIKVQHPLTVGAIVHRPPQVLAERKNQLIVNFGGIRSQLVSPSTRNAYLQLVTQALNRALSIHEFDRVLITGDPTGMRAGTDNLQVPRAEKRLLSHDEFIEQLSSSRALLTSPGLTTTYEAFACGIPTAFLPPQNWSQYLILLRLRNIGAARWSFHWIDSYPESNFEEPIPEREGVEHVTRCIQKAVGDRSAKDAMALAIQTALEGLSKQPKAASHAQAEFVEGIGVDGADAAASAIESLLV